MVIVLHTFDLKLAINKTTNGDQWKDGHIVTGIQFFLEYLYVFPLAGVVSIEEPDARYAGQLHSLR